MRRPMGMRVRVWWLVCFSALIPLWQAQRAWGQNGQQGQTAPQNAKDQQAQIQEQNAKIANMNALVEQAQMDMDAKNWQDAIPKLQQVTSIDPSNWEYASALGDCYLNTEQYDQAVDSYQKGIDAAEKLTTTDPKNPLSDPAKKKAGEARMLSNEGSAYTKLKKNKEAADAYTKAAALAPNSGKAYYNVCVIDYNAGNSQAGLEACDKAIAADPKNADAYYLKGTMLIGGSTTDKAGNVQPPPGTAEALSKYLELAPNGAHAADVKQMLAFLGSKVQSTYGKK